MARISPTMIKETPWEDLPPRPKHTDPEAKYFLMIDHRIPDIHLYSHKPDERQLYVELVRMMAKQIAEYMIDHHQEELRTGHSQLVCQRHDMKTMEHIVQMGVYILTPEEMDKLKQEWLREYQERQKAYSGRTGSW